MRLFVAVALACIAVAECLQTFGKAIIAGSWLQPQHWRRARYGGWPRRPVWFWREIRVGCVAQQGASWIRSSRNRTLPGALWRPVCSCRHWSCFASCMVCTCNPSCMAAAALYSRLASVPTLHDQADRLCNIRNCSCMSSV